MSALTLRTGRFQKWLPEYGAPVRTTVGAPRFNLGYDLAGHARLITPRYAMLKLAQPEYTVAYFAMLDEHGPDAIRAELEGIARTAGRDELALLCFEDLSKPDLWCHRRIFADWWLLRTHEVIAEAEPPKPAEPATLF